MPQASDSNMGLNLVALEAAGLQFSGAEVGGSQQQLVSAEIAGHPDIAESVKVGVVVSPGIEAEAGSRRDSGHGGER